MCNKNSLNLPRRLRRLRRSPAIRSLVSETSVSVSDLIQPIFVKEDSGAPEPIASMPGQFRCSLEDTVTDCLKLYQAGIRGVALFPKIDPARKSPDGADALCPDTLVLRTFRAIKQAVPELLIFADLALDPYTTHGHDGILNEQGTDVLNDETVHALCRMAVASAAAGADFVAPSDMMDGRVGAIRTALDEAGYTGVGILAYSAKFNSAYYGPFRDAVGSAASAGTTLLGKHTYQIDPANARQALDDALLDVAEGADMLIVKPAGPYLDVIHRLREKTLLPVAAYQVSGEYAQIHAAAQLGWLDYTRTRDESLLAIKRAGADIILTYFAREIALHSEEPAILSVESPAEGI